MTHRQLLPMFSPLPNFVGPHSQASNDPEMGYPAPLGGQARLKESAIHPSGARLFRYDGYEVVSLDAQTNRLVAQEETALYAVSLSGGLGSAIAGERAVRRFGRDRVLFWFADVKKEDEDLYRFLHDLMQRWGGRIYYFTDGRRPEVLWEKRRIIPNDRMCPCSYELKVRHFRQFILGMPHLPHVLIGYKADETERHINTCASYHDAIPNAIVEYPLLWEPVERGDLAIVCQNELGIAPPRIYSLGFDYNNCLAGETNFLTFDGIKPLNTMVGQKPLVMSLHGEWKRASIQSFGIQQLWEIKLNQHRFKKTIYATGDHRWFTQVPKSNSNAELVTLALVPGASLVSVYVDNLEPEAWIVVSVEPTDRIEEVFCAVVPDTHCFVLEDNILTGNCGGDCCRSGIGGRVLEAIHFPDRYSQSMEWEEMMRAKGGSLAGKAFCARQIQGQKTPITLREILQEYVPLVQSYLAAHPNEQISEKTVLRNAKKWHRKQTGKVVSRS